MANTEKKKTSVLSILLKYVVPLVISVGLCWLLFEDFDFHRMMAIIRDRCNYRWIAAGLAVTVCSHVFRALRWRMQLRALGINPPLFALIISIFGTYAVNLVFPRLGEVWRCGYIAQRQHAPFTSVFGSMVADRMADTITVFLLLLLTLVLAYNSIMAYLTQDAAMYEKMVSLATSPVLIGLAVACILALWWLLSRRNATGWIAALQKALRELWQGFIVVLRMPRKGVWLLYTVGIWGCFFAAMVLEMLSFDFTADVMARHGLTAALVTFVLSSISMGVPSNGGIGPWQWAVIFALGIYSLPAMEAGTFANLVMASVTLLNIALGILTFAVIAIGNRRGTLPSDNNKTQE